MEALNNLLKRAVEGNFLFGSRVVDREVRSWSSPTSSTLMILSIFVKPTKIS